MDELIKQVAERAGINSEQAKSAVNAVMDFVKDKLPGVGDQLKSLLTASGNPLGDIGNKLGGLFGS